MSQHLSFPTDLPVPVDDGACSHLSTATIPPGISLPICSDPSRTVDLSSLQGLTIVFCYPRTGAPGEVIPPEWDQIPGARGCTPQACSFRDNLSALQELGVKNIFGLSTQSPEYQKEVHDRIKLQYELLSDEKNELLDAMKLPTIEWEGKLLTKRVTLAIEDGGRVVRHWYPIFPPDKNVTDVFEWLVDRGTK